MTFVDDIGKEITVRKPATRIISLYSAHTENLYTLGLDAEIIGVGNVDIYPPHVLHKPRFDYKSDPEKLIVADPDLVLIRPFINRSRPEFVKVLEKAGLQVVSLYPDSFEKFDDYIRKLALLSGKEMEAQKQLAAFHQEIEAVGSFTQGITPKVHVYFESVEKGYKTVTSDSMPARAIVIAGGINVASDAEPVREGTSIAAYGIERLLEQAEKIDVFVSQRGAMNAGGNVHSISIRPGFHVMKAVQNKRVFEIDEKIISSPTFRYIKGIRELARMFYPEVVDDLAKFATDQEVTRKQMAEIAVRFKHRPIFVPTSRYYRKEHKGHTYGMFRDVGFQDPNFDFIETAVTSGYMEGYKEDGVEYFYPERTLNRDEFARILFMLHDFEKTETQIEIKDIGEVSKPQIVQILVSQGIMACENGYFQPNKFVTGKDVIQALAQITEL
jgi:iron complex transport system substrate-binding protein